jgi:hypothetical protein
MTDDQQQEAITALAALLARHQQHTNPDETDPDPSAETLTDPNR